MEENKDADVTNIEKTKKEVNPVKEIISWVFVVAFAFVIAFIVTNYVIVKAEVPTGSMENTIMPKDRIVGNRLAYLFSDPKRGDIMIFKLPDDETQNYVKRVIGLPGEKVELLHGKVYINDSEIPLEEPYLKEEMTGEDYIFHVPEGCYLMLGDNRNESLDARYWNKQYVQKEKIIAKVWFRYQPDIQFIK